MVVQADTKTQTIAAINILSCQVPQITSNYKGSVLFMYDYPGTPSFVSMDQWTTLTAHLITVNTN